MSAPIAGASRAGEEDELVAFLYPDVSGLSRGRAVPFRDLERRMATGIGWVPADQAMTVFGPLGHPNPWGSMGDLRLVPDPDTRVRVDLWPDAPALHFMFCEARTLDGAPWNACPRVLLREALQRLEAETGLRLWAAFEHEFVLQGHSLTPPPAFTMEALRLAEPFGAHLSAALRLAGQELDTFLPEYGDDQFEVTCAPLEGLAAADAASTVRELVREVARRHGWRANFAPLQRPDGSGNGLHVHMSLRDREGRPVMHDSARPGGLSVVAGRFAAGVLARLAPLCAVAAPTAVSYLRLVPHRWSAGWASLGAGDREAALRIPTPTTFGGGSAADQTRLEFRAADGACSPHFALALIVLAGLEGIRGELDPPPVQTEETDSLADEERQRRGIGVMPGSLEEAVTAFEEDELVRAEVSEDLRAGYVALKRMELSLLDGVTPEDACARYAAVY